MRLNPVISILFISLMFFKGLGSFAPLFSSSLKGYSVSKMLMDIEREQETKGSKTAESVMTEDVFEAAPSLSYCFDIIETTGRNRAGIASPLQDVYLDTLTPPPNRLSC